MPSGEYGMAAGTRQRENVNPRASFLGIPPEVQVSIYRMLLCGIVLRIWHVDWPKFRIFMHNFATAIISTCRQASGEANPVLFITLVLRFEWHECWDTNKQVHPRIQEPVLPYIRRLTFLRNGVGTILPVDQFRQWSPNLKVLDIRSTTFGISLSRNQMYDAATNKVRALETSPRRTATAVSSCNRFLINMTLKKYGIQDTLGDQYVHTSQSKFD